MPPSTTDVHVGRPSAKFCVPIEDKIHVHFHDFASLTIGRDRSLISPDFQCAGYTWRLVCYPDGQENSKNGMIAAFLLSESPPTISPNTKVSILKVNGADYDSANFRVYSDGTDTDRVHLSGSHNFINRGFLLDPSKGLLNNGTLTFVVRIKPHFDDNYCQTSELSASVRDDILSLYNDKESVDVAFSVQDKIFYAHRLILKGREPQLADLCEQFSLEAPMPISDLDQNVFEMMLMHVYGKNIYANDWKRYARQILEASGKYGFSSLKLEAEAWHVKFLKLTVDNVIDELLYADGTDCVLLKRAAMDFIIKSGQEVLASSTYDKLDESPRLRKEVMMEFAKDNESRKRKRGD